MDVNFEINFMVEAVRRVDVQMCRVLVSVTEVQLEGSFGRYQIVGPNNDRQPGTSR